jgi:HAMP domain-containing protein/ligand-binding sensor protein
VFSKVGSKVAVLVSLVLLAVMAAGTWYIVDRQGSSLETQLLERGRIQALVGAKFIGKVLEEAIDNGVFSVKDAFDQDYVPIPGFEPEKYHTRYDAYLDKAILSMEDEFLQDASVVYAVAVDVNGYLPTHNTRYQQPISGDKQQDLVGNRTKRIFNDPVGIKAAQNLEPLLQQIYRRDTGETMWDISAPILVKGQHWGGFRIGFSLVKTQQAKAALAETLAVIMLGILLLATILVFFIVSRALAPLSRLTRIAGELADGRVNDKVEKSGKDEISQLADALERLRVSLKAAMDRLTRVK